MQSETIETRTDNGISAQTERAHRNRQKRWENALAACLSVVIVAFSAAVFVSVTGRVFLHGLLSSELIAAVFTAFGLFAAGLAAHCLDVAHDAAKAARVERCRRHGMACDDATGPTPLTEDNGR